MKNYVNYFKLILSYIAIDLILVTSIPHMVLSSSDTDYIIVSQGDLDSALHSLQLLKPIGPRPKIYYRFDFNTKELTKVDRRDYMLNSPVASPNHQWVWESKNILVNAKGEKKTLTLPNDIMESVWSPQADKIAYIRGKSVIPPEEREHKFPEKGIWIYDISTHTKTKISDIVGYDLAWPAIDNNLYINTVQWEPSSGIYRYNFKTEKVELTPYKGLNFSPNGKYYSTASYEAPSHFYQREPHKELTKIIQNMQNNGTWLGDGHSYLFSAGWPPPKFAVYDLEKGQVTKTIEGAYLGMNRAKTHAVFMTGVDQLKVVDLLSP